MVVTTVDLQQALVLLTDLLFQAVHGLNQAVGCQRLHLPVFRSSLACVRVGVNYISNHREKAENYLYSLFLTCDVGDVRRSMTRDS